MRSPLTAVLDDNDFFGNAVTGLGDLDGDGVTDIAAGAYSDDDGGSGRGAVHVLFLNTDGTVKAEQKVSSTAGALTGPLEDTDLLGPSVTGLGDLDGDGRIDLVAGAIGDDDGGPDRGAVYVLSLASSGFVVNSTGDAGDSTPGDGVRDTAGTNSGGAIECTLRAAIEEANALAGSDTISFNIPATEPAHSGGIWTISPGSELPSVTGEATLDATTQPGWTSTPVVELNGAGAGAFADGLRLFSTNSEIRGFAINRFPADGIEVDGAASNTEGDPECTLRAAIESANAVTNLDAIEFAIPDSDPGHTNLGATNSYWSIQPAAALPTLTDDDASIDGTTQATFASSQGYFSNSFGPSIELDGSVVAAIGLQVAANTATIRGLVINRFATGISLTGGTGTVIAGNYVGPDVSGAIGEVGNTSDGIYIYGATNTTVGGSVVADRNVISGNRQRGIWINDASDGAAAFSSGTAVLGNYIGTDANGAAALPYDAGGAAQQIGIALWDGPNNVFGGPGLSQGNIISGHSWHGVYIWGPNASGNTVQGKIVGLDALGNAAIGNGSNDPAARSGLAISSAAGNLVGGTDSGEGNIFAGMRRTAARSSTASDSVSQPVIRATAPEYGRSLPSQPRSRQSRQRSTSMPGPNPATARLRWCRSMAPQQWPHRTGSLWAAAATGPTFAASLSSSSPMTASRSVAPPTRCA